MYFYGRFITMFLPTINETGDLRGRPWGLMGLESRTMGIFFELSLFGKFVHIVNKARGL